MSTGSFHEKKEGPEEIEIEDRPGMKMTRCGNYITLLRHLEDGYNLNEEVRWRCEHDTMNFHCDQIAEICGKLFALAPPPRDQAVALIEQLQKLLGESIAAAASPPKPPGPLADKLTKPKR